jgi:hypothetical protein
MNMAVTVVLFVLCWSAVTLRAQDWADVQALPPDTAVRIVAAGGELRGRITAIEDTQLTVLARSRPWVIRRDEIVRLEREIRDPLWNGMIIGALAILALRVAFYGEACARDTDPGCTLKGVLGGAALGAFVDFQTRRHDVIYRAPPPTLTFLRWSF